MKAASFRKTVSRIVSFVVILSFIFSNAGLGLSYASTANQAHLRTMNAERPGLAKDLSKDLGGQAATNGATNAIIKSLIEKDDGSVIKYRLRDSVFYRPIYIDDYLSSDRDYDNNRIVAEQLLSSGEIKRLKDLLTNSLTRSGNNKMLDDITIGIIRGQAMVNPADDDSFSIEHTGERGAIIYFGEALLHDILSNNIPTNDVRYMVNHAVDHITTLSKAIEAHKSREYKQVAARMRARCLTLVPATQLAAPAVALPAELVAPSIIGRAESKFGPHPSQEGLRPYFERIAWARKNTPAGLKIAKIYAFLDDKHGMKVIDSISFGIILEGDEDGQPLIINLDAPVAGGISAGKEEPDTQRTIKEAIDFFNNYVAGQLIGLNVGRPDAITDKIVAIDNELQEKAPEKDRPQFSYIGSEISTGVSIMATLALAEALHVTPDMVVNYDINEYAMTNFFSAEPRMITIPVDFSVVWEGGKHGAAKTLKELVDEGIIADARRFPARFSDPKLIEKKDKSILLGIVPPQELQIMSFAPDWPEARRVGIKLTDIYKDLLTKRGIKTKFGAESGLTTDQIRTKDKKLITTELTIDILDEAVGLLTPDEAKYVRYAWDIASSEMYIPEIDKYYIGPESAKLVPGMSDEAKRDGLVTNDEFTLYKLYIFAKHPRFISCEDWGVDDKPEHWAAAVAIMKEMIQMGDDNLVSRGDLIEKFADLGVINAQLQKPNQSANSRAAYAAVSTSHSRKVVVVTSHRGTRAAHEKYTAWFAMGAGTLAGKWTLRGPGRGALIAAMEQTNTLYQLLGVNVPYQGALVLNPNGPYNDKDYGWAARVRRDIASGTIAAPAFAASLLEAPVAPLELKTPLPAALPLKPYATLDDVDVSGKTVLVRPDLNVQAEKGHIVNPQNPHRRVAEAAKTLKELSEKGAKVVVMFHQGRPGEPDFMGTPEEHAAQLGKLTGRKVIAIDDLFGDRAIKAIKALKDGEILVLKPVRAKDPSTGKTLEENPYFVSILKPYFDLVVADAFSAFHRDSASITGFTGIPAVAGRLAAYEIEGAEKLRNPPQPHLVVVGGGKVDDKIKELINSLKQGRADKVIVGGRLANLALIAAQPSAAEAASNDQNLYGLAESTLGKATADDLKANDFLGYIPKLVELLLKYGDKIELPVDMAYIDASGTAVVVNLVNGRIPGEMLLSVGLLNGIGTKTAENYAAVANRTDNPFKSASVIGPLSDSRFDVLNAQGKTVLGAVSQIPFWSLGGGDTGPWVKGLGFTPTYESLAGGALAEFLTGATLPGVKYLADNMPGKQGAYAAATDAEAHVMAHTSVFAPIAQAMKDAGEKVIVRTSVFKRGGKVGAIGITNNGLASAVKGRLEAEGTAQALAGLETSDINSQNPWLEFSITTLRTPDRRPINPDAVRKLLAARSDVALIETPAEVDKKGKMGNPGQIDTRKLEEKLNALLIKELRRKGVDPNTAKTITGNVPAIAQVSKSSVPGELKLAIFVPTPKSDICRLIQLAKDSGIDIKKLLEKTMPAPKVEGEVALLGEVRPVAEVAPKMPEPIAAPKFVSPLAGFDARQMFNFPGSNISDGVEVNEAMQAIVVKSELVGMKYNNLDLILERVLNTKKLVSIVVPLNSQVEKEMQFVIGFSKKDNLTITSHPVVRQGANYTAFVIQPKVRYVFVGYGNEAIKLGPAFEESGFGKPSVSIFSLNRPERVLHAFEMGYGVYLTDNIVADKSSGKKINMSEDPAQLAAFETKLKKLLVDAYIAKARNELLSGIPQSQRAARASDILRQAQDEGTLEAEGVFDAQYKGLLSTALNNGDFDLVVDCTPEKSGAANKETLYLPALALHPGMKFIYQGGEKEKVAEASFSAITADFDSVTDLTHVRHVSCNTTGLSSIVMPILERLGVPIVADNMAIRRVVDPGDIKEAVVSTQYIAGYHHGPDFMTVTPEDDLVLVDAINTDAALSGATTRFHMHVLSLRRADGKKLSKQEVQKVLAVQSRVALVDFPNGIFDSTRFSEMTHNLLAQWIAWAPEGANHPLVPIVTVQETDDPAELRLIYGVPQESIVAPGNVNAAHAILGLAGKDASLALVNDAMGIPQLVQAVETRLPVEGLNQETLTLAQEAPVEAVAPLAVLDMSAAGIAKNLVQTSDLGAIRSSLAKLTPNTLQAVRTAVEAERDSVEVDLTATEGQEDAASWLAGLQSKCDHIDSMIGALLVAHRKLDSFMGMQNQAEIRSMLTELSPERLDEIARLAGQRETEAKAAMVEEAYGHEWYAGEALRAGGLAQMALEVKRAQEEASAIDFVEIGAKDVVDQILGVGEVELSAADIAALQPEYETLAVLKANVAQAVLANPEAAEWYAGQLAAAEHAVELLEIKLLAAKAKTPAPEANTPEAIANSLVQTVSLDVIRRELIKLSPETLQAVRSAVAAERHSVKVDQTDTDIETNAGDWLAGLQSKCDHIDAAIGSILEAHRMVGKIMGTPSLTNVKVVLLELNSKTLGNVRQLAEMLEENAMRAIYDEPEAVELHSAEASKAGTLAEMIRQIQSGEIRGTVEQQPQAVVDAILGAGLELEEMLSAADLDTLRAAEDIFEQVKREAAAEIFENPEAAEWHNGAVATAGHALEKVQQALLANVVTKDKVIAELKDDGNLAKLATALAGLKDKKVEVIISTSILGPVPQSQVEQLIQAMQRGGLKNLEVSFDKTRYAGKKGWSRVYLINEDEIDGFTPYSKTQDRAIAIKALQVDTQAAVLPWAICAGLGLRNLTNEDVNMEQPSAKAIEVVYLINNKLTPTEPININTLSKLVKATDFDVIKQLLHRIVVSLPVPAPMSGKDLTDIFAAVEEAFKNI